MTPPAQPARRKDRPLLGLRRRPGRLALALFRMPLNAYRHGAGVLLGRTFLQLTHVGRKTGLPHNAVAMDDEAFDVAIRFRRQHPHRLRLISSILGWGDLRDDARVRRFVQTHPFVAFRPAASLRS